MPVTEAALMRAIELNGVKPEENAQAFTWGRIAVADPAGLAALAGVARPAPQTLEELIARRAARLEAYQNRAYAERYRARVGAVMDAERDAVGAPGALSEAVAKGLFKLMAYKDEYEVARLHSEMGFEQSLTGRFEPGFKVKYHLAPPLLAGPEDARGRPGKRAFGPWMGRAMAGLAKLKGLRGTFLDPFGYSAERRMERALIGEYEAVIDRLLRGLTADTRDAAAEIAGRALEIRGFGPVKEAAVARVRADMAERLLRYEKM